LCYTTYWQIFQAMNLYFHTKKDRCETCKRFWNLDHVEQNKAAENFQEHHQKAEKIINIKDALKHKND